MKNLMQCVVFFGIICGLPLFAVLDKSQKGMLNDIESIRIILEEGYAQQEWKNEYLGWNLETQIENAKQQVSQPKPLSLKEFWGVLGKIFRSAQDYHLGISFCSTEEASIPFTVRSAEGKYYFTHIASKLKMKGFPFSIGDELVLFDGVPVHTVVTEIKNHYLGHHIYEATDYALAEDFLTHRFGRMGHQVPDPDKKIFLTGVSKSTGKVIKYAVAWKYHAEEMLGFGTQPKKVFPYTHFMKQFILPEYTQLASKHKIDASNRDTLGSRKSFLPALGNIVWVNGENNDIESDYEEDDHDQDDNQDADFNAPPLFDAYLFETNDGRIGGYVRIPTFLPITECLDSSEFPFSQHLREFAQIVRKFEEEADIMVIDQVNNPGGDVLYTYSLLSMLTNSPLHVSPHHIMLSQDEVFGAIQFQEMFKLGGLMEDLFDDIFGDLFEDEIEDDVGDMTDPALNFVGSITSYFNTIIQEWNKGNHFTKPIYLLGMDVINPFLKAQFTKPILVLVNHLDFSGADFFPAILQDNQRAVIFGTRTAGAGGYIKEKNFSNTRGIASVRYTASIAIRPNGKPIENLGITPDVPYEISAFDLQNDYAGYVAKVQETLTSLLPEVTSTEPFFDEDVSSTEPSSNDLRDCRF